jgi:glycosyltransferase involved in cell wall biosynthesis
MHSRDLDKGSTRFRVVNYQPWLESQGLALDYVNRQDINAHQVRQYDVLFNQKCRLSAWTSSRLRRAAKRIVFDFDDAIWTRARKPYGRFVGRRVRRRLDWWFEAADVVTTSSQYLADYARRVTQNVRVIPMAVDTEVWQPLPRPEDGRVRIGWAGRPGNLRYLKAIEAMLAEVQRLRPQVEYAIYSGEKPDLTVSFCYEPFAAGTEARFIQSLDVGLLPLDDGEFAKGKSPIKAIQYLACGVPVVGNVVGASHEIVTAGNGLDVALAGGWTEALLHLIDNPQDRHTRGIAGRAHVLVHNNLVKTRHTLYAAITGQEPGEPAGYAGTEYD